MARVINPLLSTDASGTTSGIQFTHTRAGHAARTAARGSPRPTPARDSARAAISRAVHAWRRMPDDQRDIWKQHAPFPGLGFGLYISRAVPLIRFGFSPPQSPLPHYDQAPPQFWLGPQPEPPDYTVTVNITPPPLLDCLSILKVAVVPRGHSRPHPRQFLIRDYAALDIELLTWTPNYDFGAAYIDVTSRWIRTGQIVSQATFYLET